MDMSLSLILIAAALISGYLFGLSEGISLVDGFHATRFPQ